MDKPNIPTGNPLSGLVSQDRRQTRSVTRALETQSVASILTQIDTGIAQRTEIFPSNYLNRCTDLIFGRAQENEGAPTIKATEEFIVEGQDNSLSFSGKLERLVNMSQDQPNGASHSPTLSQGANTATATTSNDQLTQLMAILCQQSQMMTECMNEIRQMRGEMVSISQRVADVECSTHASGLAPPGSSSTPDRGASGSGTQQGADNEADLVDLNDQDPPMQGQMPPSRGNNKVGDIPHTVLDRTLGMSYSRKELDARKPVDLDRWHIKFDGTCRDMTVESFIFRIEKMREQYNIPYSQLFSDFQCLVTGNAAKWYWQVLEDNAEDVDFGYFSLKRELLGHFKSADLDYEIIREIMDRKQQPGEHFEEFYTDIHNLTFRLRKKIPEHELVQIVRANLRSNIASLIFSATITTISDLRRECRRAEKLIKESRQRSRPLSEVSKWNTTESDDDVVNVEAVGASNGRYSKNQFRPAVCSGNAAVNNRCTPGNISSSSLNATPQLQGEQFCPSPFHMNLCFTCGMPGDYYRKASQGEIKPENVCRSTFHDMKCFVCGKDCSFCTYVPKNFQVAEIAGNCCQNTKAPETTL